MYGHTGKRHLQITGGLSGPHHAHHDARKNILISHHGIRQGITLLHVGQHIEDRPFQPFVFCLLRQHLQRFLHGHACLGDTDKLTAEHTQIPGLYFSAQRKIYFFVQDTLFLDGQGHQAAFADLLRRPFPVLGIHTALCFSASLIDCHIRKSRHVLPPFL